MFKFQPFMLHYPTSTTNASEQMIPIDRQPHERSLSPDSLEQRLLKHQIMLGDGGDDDESFPSSTSSSSSSSSSLVDSINLDQQQSQSRQSKSTKTIIKTLTSHGLLTNLTFVNSIANDHDDEEMDDDDLDEIHIDQDEVNLLFSDPDDGIVCRLNNGFLDDDYDDENEDFGHHRRPIPFVTPSNLIIPPLISVHDQAHQYSPYHLLDPISEAASEEERRAAISIIRQQPKQKQKHSTSSSLSTSANGHCDGDTTTNDDLSTLSDIDEHNTSMDEHSASQPSSLSHEQQQQQHLIHRQRHHTENYSTKNGSKLTGDQCISLEKVVHKR